MLSSTKVFSLQLKLLSSISFHQALKKSLLCPKQLLKSGTSIGANVRESEHAESKADFIHKLSIALKEANETSYWLELLKATGYLENSDYLGLKNDVNEILRLLISIIKSAKR